MSMNRNIALRRLKRDLIELERADIPSIAAHPLDDDIFTWHVNIRPTDGVYSGVYFHLILRFPSNYPAKPPTVELCTTIRHPNVFGRSLCLSMLRPYTSTQAYEGWSSAYSATSVCLQLQSFLFAEKIDQDGGYQVSAYLSNDDVRRSLDICRNFKCHKCGHSHTKPWPKIKGCVPVIEPLINLKSDNAIVQGLACSNERNWSKWVNVCGEIGFNFGRIMYEVSIDRVRGSCVFGFGSQNAQVCGRCPESFGYGGPNTGMFSHDNKLEKYGQSFSKGDTITCAVDFGSSRIYFAKNGQIMEPDREMKIPQNLGCGLLLFPIASFKNSRIEFNFGKPKRPCQWLLENGFKTMEEPQQRPEKVLTPALVDDDQKSVDWHSEFVIDELWLSVFECLQVPELNRVQFTCTKWNKVIKKFNIMERNEIFCFYSKARLGKEASGSSKIFGIGLNIEASPTGKSVVIKSQMDILSRGAWQNGCRHGVWGEKMTHFLPLAMNKMHSQLAYDDIIQHLGAIGNVLPKRPNIIPNEFEKSIAATPCLQSIDTLITMMNQIVVQFVMDNQVKKDDGKATVSMVMCEKVVLGYCALNHLLLLLRSKNKKIVNSFANNMVRAFLHKSTHKNCCRDLGKLLIWLMLSTEFEWCDVAKLFVQESFSRKVRWMIKNPECKHLNTTSYVAHRLRHTLNVSKTGLRLVMFQVWFMKNTATQTLKGYNERLGRPQSKVRNEIFVKSKFILNSNKWSDYFNELDVVLQSDKDLDQLLRFSIYRSKQMGYHYANHSMPDHQQHGGGGGYGNNQHQGSFSHNGYPQQRHYNHSYNNGYAQGRQQHGYGYGYGGGMQRQFNNRQPQMYSNQYGMQQRQQPRFGNMDRRQSDLHIDFMKPPAMKIKGVRQCAKPLPPTGNRVVHPVQHQKNVYKAPKRRIPNCNESQHYSAPKAQHQPQRKQAAPIRPRPTKPPMKQKNVKPAQTGYNSPVSSSASSVQQKQVQPGTDQAKLSKSQQRKLRKRLAKERKKEAQKYYKV